MSTIARRWTLLLAVAGIVALAGVVYLVMTESDQPAPDAVSETGPNATPHAGTSRTAAEPPSAVEPDRKPPATSRAEQTAPPKRSAAEREPASAPAPAAPAPANRVTGSVAAGGQPVQGARLVLRTKKVAAFGIIEWGDEVAKGTSGADGRFALEAAGAIPPAANYAIVATHKDFVSGARDGLNVAATGATDAGVITLTRGATVRGIVRSVDAGPLGGVSIAVVDPAVPEAFGGRRAIRTKTDANGGFAISRVAAGKIRIEVKAPEHAITRWEGTVEEGRDLSGLEIVATRGAAITGTIVDDRGLPIPDVEVAAAGNRESYKTTTDATGAFRLAHLRDGATYHLIPRKKGFGVRPNDTQPTNFVSGTENVRFVLERLGRVSGIVVDAATNKPVEAFVVKWGQHAKFLFSSRTFKSADGRFEIDGIVAGPVVVEVRAKAYAATRVPELRMTAGGHVMNQTARLRVGGRATGRLVDLADKTPLGGATIYVTVAEQGGGVAFGQDQVKSSAIRTVRTGADGTFAIDHLIGAHTIHVRVPGRAAKRLPTTAFPESGTVELGDIPIGNGGIITGVVRKTDGTPEPKAEVLIHNRTGFSRKALTGQDGRFEMKGVPAGRYQAIVTGRGGSMSPAALIQLARGEGANVDVTEGGVSVLELR